MKPVLVLAAFLVSVVSIGQTQPKPVGSVSRPAPPAQPRAPAPQVRPVEPQRHDSQRSESRHGHSGRYGYGVVYVSPYAPDVTEAPAAASVYVYSGPDTPNCFGENCKWDDGGNELAKWAATHKLRARAKK